ncbi:hypothetical protein BMR1_03g00040 [Babesia microti strain RI]|uniref:Uncharacterized protein n=1 Tax=Babesia microti (strain RI) TaxID=1133968 RepID=A0A0K3APP6_BABMR|nr:hypothetical protein BMR1_03g00040 [Babesia microti strain RI]CTQ40608.1 hypothetical protein BMR1_03g00040 [Babesia microti strain RI]|eukprot:XP_012648619.1 hypothetical protein BMR1_03g00040 [Babesia microti strain RI]
MINNILKQTLIKSRKYYSVKRFPWSEYDEIASILHSNHPFIDPLQLRFHELHEMVTDLVDKPNECSEGKLEAIQMAWFNLKQE